MTGFCLSEAFLEDFQKITPSWGPIGEFIFKTKYARPIPNEERTEEWWETIKRVVEGVYQIQKEHCSQLKLPWNGTKAKHSAQEMYDLMFKMKFLPPGRGLWAMGTDIIKLKGSAPLFNCSFVSSDDIATSFSEPFCYLMDMSMLGVGVGFDTRGAGKIRIKEPRKGDYVFVIDDSREGWVELIRTYIDSYFGRASLPKQVDFSKVRPYGAPIKIFGGTSSGPDPLKQLLIDIEKILEPLAGELITSTAIVDLFNAIGKCVVSGNVRRSASISLGDPNDLEYLSLKDPKKIQLKDWRFASNNSIFATVGMDYTKIVERTIQNGEPGFFWLENARQYHRMNDPPHQSDQNIVGINPCQPGFATLVNQKGRIITLENLQLGDQVWSGQRYTKVINKQMTGIKPVYAYYTSAGIFYGTKQHRVISEGKKIEVQYAKTIDRCWYPGDGTFWPTCDQEMTDILQYVMDGLVLGDGGIHKASNNLVGLYIGINDQDYFKDPIKSLIKEWRPGIKDTFYTIQTTITYKELPKPFLREIPDRYFYGSLREKAFFLRGLYSANGSIVGQRITLKSASRKLITQVQVMLSSLGIRSYITINKKHMVTFSNGDYECKESYDLNITQDRNLFQQYIGFIQIYKQEKVKQLCNTIICSGRIQQSFKIDKVEFLGNMPVYDITVDAEEHTYWTGGLLVSNCAEISCNNKELCNVPEIYFSKHETFDELKRTLKFAYLYAKTTTLVPCHNDSVNAIQLKNRKIGLSISGVAQSIKKHGVRKHFQWCDTGYNYLRQLDIIYSDWLCIPKSRKITSIKPSGSVSLVANATPGVHFPYAEYYWRTVRIDSGSAILKAFKKAGYRIEEGEGHNTSVIYFPVKEENFWKSRKDVSIWEQLEIIAQHQFWWTDNQVSATVTFKPEEACQIKEALELYETRLKSISFLPLIDHGYKHAPYQPISKEVYEEEVKKLKKVNFKHISETQGHEKSYCDSDVCELKQGENK